MTDQTDFLKNARQVWSQVRGFGSLWLALASLGGAVILVGGYWMLNLLTSVFGPRGDNPGWVIGLLLIGTLPLAIYLWIQERQNDEHSIVCPQCGEKSPRASAACPKCGAARDGESSADKKFASETATA